ncbi:hypothetical protein QCN29_07480 [Streptomyces sp. HNM0663]|uniref:Uncharacterized protein n=1 Tax=Streptomyces chengmaiensis TaxID=3040919 RepID=A0ABT6HIX4_9ACTN|nr:hypothetical protein [Streptomyces chengmaiensis]MDH2388628.1 hypothetical protein [Streptomyces chengmaiensis]
MGNRADDYGTDVEIYVKALTTTIHAATPTGAPAKLHGLLEQLGLERHEYPVGAPLYVWHTVPDHLGAEEQKRLASRAIPPLLMAGYKVNIDPDLFDETAYQQAAREVRANRPRPARRQPPPAASSSRPTPSRLTP